MKKTLIIILVIIILLSLSLGIYFYLKSRKTLEIKTTIEGKVFETVMESPKFSDDKKWVYYYSSQQIPAFYRSELSSKKAEQISENLDDIQEITYSPDLTKVGFKVAYNRERFEKYASPFLDPKMEDSQSR